MNKILIIEDNSEIRENTAEILELNGYHVCTAENGREGFDIALRYQPDIILCDIMMPETDGRAFLKMVKSNGTINNIPVIFFSAGSCPELQRDLIEGKNSYLKKPFTEKDLLLTIKAGLEKRFNHSVYQQDTVNIA